MDDQGSSDYMDGWNDAIDRVLFEIADKLSDIEIKELKEKLEQ